MRTITGLIRMGFALLFCYVIQAGVAAIMRSCESDKSPVEMPAVTITGTPPAPSEVAHTTEL